MLVQHERERDFLFYNKVQMNSNNIQNKQQMLRPNRAGVLRQIVDIEPHETPQRLIIQAHNLKKSMEDVPLVKYNLLDESQRFDGLVEIGKAKYLNKTSK